MLMFNDIAGFTGYISSYVLKLSKFGILRTDTLIIKLISLDCK